MHNAVPNLNDANAVLNYGAEAQSRIAEFSEIALKNLKSKDPKEVNGRMEALISHLKEPSEDKSLLRHFRKPGQHLKNRCQKALESVDRIALSLQTQRDALMKDIEMLDLLYTMNREQYDNLTSHLDRGREALARFREETLLPRKIAAEESGSPADAHAARDAEAQYERFEKKLHDLELTRAVSLQMAPQIRLLQNNNSMLAEKIQSSVVNTIPLWKSQMVLTLSMENSRTAIQMQEKVSDVTDALLIGNAQKLKDTSLAVTKEASRGYISADALKKTNALLAETLDEMLRLQEEGCRARREAEMELHRMEQEIRLRLSERRERKPLP